MYLRILEIQGFKCFGERFSIEFGDGLNVLVGENGAGKTGVVSAIRQIFNDSESGKRFINEGDFYRGFEKDAVAAESITIEATFGGLSEPEGVAFVDWCGGRPEAKLALSVANRESRGRYRQVIVGGELRNREVDPETLDLVHCIYLPPLRDAETKLREGRQSRLSRLLKALCRKDLDKHRKEGSLHPLEEKVSIFNTELSESNDFAIKQANKLIGDNLKNALGMKLSQGTVIQFSEVNFLKIVEGLRLLYFPDISKVDASQFRSLEENSLGYNNLLYVASILAELIMEEEEDVGEKTFLRLLLIEEPEAHLHPQLQIRLLRYLKTVAERRNIQVIITTHSTVISSAVSVENIIHLCSVKGVPSAVPLRKCGLPTPSVKFIDRWLDVTKSNLLFSKGIIFVEGIVEGILVPELAKIVLKEYGDGLNSLDDYGVSVINLNGIYFKHFMQLFCDVNGEQHGMNIPVRCAGLTDNDPPKVIVVEEEGVKKGVQYLPHQNNYMVGENYVLELIDSIAQSEFCRLYSGRYKTFEYDLGLEGNNLQRMFMAAAENWPTDHTVKASLEESATKLFSKMEPEERAKHSLALLDRIDSDSMGKGLYAQVFADELAKGTDDFIVPEYIRDAIYWACSIEQKAAQ